MTFERVRLLARLAAACMVLAWMPHAARAQVGGAAGAPATGDLPCSGQTGANYSGQNVAYVNFSRQDLTNATFRGATLTGVSFIGANLTCADFSGATFAPSARPPLVSDFTLANLSGTSFNGAKFNDTTYFTYATVTCADFSNTDLGSGNAVFGDDPLIYDKNTSCRTKFRSTTMNCEFVGDWNAFDLTSAIVSACKSQFAKHDFSGAVLASVVFDGIDLTGSSWHGTDLTGASFQGATLDNATGLSGTQAQPSRLAGALFNNASVQNVNLSNAQLYGANFTNANLTGSSLQGAFLTNNPPAIRDPAIFTGAHLKNVNLAAAQLAGATFDGASFYGSFGGLAPTFPCQTDTTKCPGSATGFTCGCASAAGANLTRTDFSNAFLYGVDFTGGTTTVNGTRFNGAIVVAASFSGASFNVDPSNGGAPPDFSNAYLQGTNLGANATLTNTSLTGAFVDFGAATNPNNGNILQILLPAKYTSFRGWTPQAAPVCVQAAYLGTGSGSGNAFTIAPTGIASMTCPDGQQHPGGCGATQAGNTFWQSAVPLAQATPPGWYQLDATYTKADQGAACNAGTVNPNW